MVLISVTSSNNLIEHHFQQRKLSNLHLKGRMLDLIEVKKKEQLNHQVKMYLFSRISQLVRKMTGNI